MVSVKIVGNVSRTTRTIILSSLLNKSIMITIANIDSEVPMYKLYHKTSLSRTVFTHAVAKLEKAGLVIVRYDSKNSKRKIIIPTPELLEIRDRIVNLVRKIEEVEHL